MSARVMSSCVAQLRRWVGAEHDSGYREALSKLSKVSSNASVMPDPLPGDVGRVSGAIEEGDCITSILSTKRF
jgi:hypothetical protein